MSGSGQEEVLGIILTCVGQLTLDNPTCGSFIVAVKADTVSS